MCQGGDGQGLWDLSAEAGGGRFLGWGGFWDKPPLGWARPGELGDGAGNRAAAG